VLGKSRNDTKRRNKTKATPTNVQVSGASALQHARFILCYGSPPASAVSVR